MPTRPLSLLAAVTALVAGLALAAPPARASSIVYACGLNLCSIGADGTGQRQVTSDGTSTRPYTWPSLSRDGARMSWIRNGDLFIGTPAATPAVGPIVRSAQYAVLRPDGAQVGALVMSFVFFGDYLYVYDAGGATVFDGPSPANYSLGWAPDGTVLLPWHGDPKIGICAIARDPDGGWACARRVAADPGADLDFPAVSPDGRLLAVQDAGRIAVFDYASGAFLRFVTAGPTDTAPTWSPDSAAIAFQRGDSASTTEVRVVGADGTGERRLAGGGAQTPSWGGPADAAARTLRADATQRGASVRATVVVTRAGSRMSGKLTTTSGRAVGTLSKRGLKAGTLRLTVPLGAGGRSALRRAGKLRLRLRVTVTPPTGRAVTLSRSLTLRR